MAEGDGSAGGSVPRSPRPQPRPVQVDPVELFLTLLMNREDHWHKANRISRAQLQQKYPDASRFSKTDGNVAAIDFGTTFCSLAFATVGNPDLVDMRSVEINNVRLNGYYTRVPTVILLRESKSTNSASCECELPNSVNHREAGVEPTPSRTAHGRDPPVSRTCKYEVVSFGYDAMTQLSSLKASQRSKYLYFERFKMTLQQDKVRITESEIVMHENA